MNYIKVNPDDVQESDSDKQYISRTQIDQVNSLCCKPRPRVTTKYDLFIFTS